MTYLARCLHEYTTMSETIALFGTSADPPTIGHSAILSWLSEHYDRVFVWAVDNPFKADQTPLCHRQKMLKVLLNTMVPLLPNVDWKPDLSDRYSLTSVQRVKKLCPEATLALVIGSDILASLSDWYAIDQLIKMVEFVVIQRPGVPPDSSQLDAFRARGGHIEIADFCGPEVSSSDFRLHHCEEILPPTVLDYVKAHGLYQTEEVHV